MAKKEDLDIYLILFVGTCVILLLAIAIIVFFIFYRKKILEQQILLEKKESEYRFYLLKSIIETTELERKRIAGDLHDEIGSYLSTIRMLFNAIIKKAEKNSELENLTQETKQLIDTVILRVRTISHNILPPGLDKFGLKDSLVGLIDKINLSNSINMEVDFGNLELCFDKEIELAIYRILQELITNTINHANASHIDIHFSMQGHILEIVYLDNGCGISIENFNNQKGLGILNIKSRVLSLKGNIIFNTNEINGFNLKIEIPLNNETDN